MKNTQKLVEKFLSFSYLTDKIKRPLDSDRNGGVAITFDDKSISEWNFIHEKLKKLNWKATFCVSEIDSLNKGEIEMLKGFQDYGHEIAGHGYRHLNAVKYVKKYGIEAYISEEIIPMITSMKEKSLSVSSFAYPYGEHNSKIDKVLLEYFKIIRGTCFYGIPPELNICYFDYSRVVYGIGIDTQYKHMSEKFLRKLLDYALDKKKILVLYGHKISIENEKGYYVNPYILEIIAEYVSLNNMSFYSLSDLNNLRIRRSNQMVSI